MSFAVPGYRVERLLGVGSQGEVWLGEELGSGQPVALKRIRLHTPAAAEAARTEAALLAALDHPSLIALRAFVPLEEAAVLVLELAAAGTLAGLLARRRRLTPPEVVATISPVASGLAHAHDAGVLHGDVSAANILFTPAGRAKLADLGMARLLAAAAEPPLGTPAYLDPTIAAGGPAGMSSDVFSLAAVALHALTGAGPWSRPDQPAPSAEEALAVAASGRPVDLAGRLRPLPSAMAAVLIRALDRDPARRGSAAELALDLRASLPPASVMLAGGRIVGRTRPEHPALAPAAGQLSYVPADLTQIARPRPALDVAGVLRAGGLAEPDSDAPALGRAHDRRGRAIARRARASVRRLPAAFVGRLKPVGQLSPRASEGAARRGRSTGRHHAGQVRQIRQVRLSWLARLALPVRPTRRARPARSARIARMIAALLVAGTLAAACSIGWPRLHRRAAAASVGERTPGAAGARPATGPSATGPSADPSLAGVPGARTPAAAPATAHPSIAEIESVLTGLAAVRERAFAQRQPALLAAAYASPSLLTADTAQLLHGVPAGCQLVGLHTSYRDVQALPPVGGTAAGPGARPMAAGGTAVGDGTRSVSLAATATLSAATLSCAGTTRGHSRPAGPVRLRLVLTDDGHGWRIASQRLG